jgi:hypothetical protein
VGSEELIGLARRLRPHILINDRTDLPGDFVTPEQYQPAARMAVNGQLVPWEACQTLNGSWGYDRDNLDWKPSSGQLYVAARLQRRLRRSARRPCGPHHHHRMTTTDPSCGMSSERRGEAGDCGGSAANWHLPSAGTANPRRAIAFGRSWWCERCGFRSRMMTRTTESEARHIRRAPLVRQVIPSERPD